MKDVELACAKLNGDDARANAIDNDHVHDLKFVKETDFVFDALLVERLQDHVPGAVGGMAGAAHQFLAEFARVPAESALADALRRGAVKWQAHVLELNDGVHGVFGEDFRGVLVSQIIAALDGVVGVVDWLVFIQVAQCRADAALRRAGVAARGVELADDRDIRAALAGIERRHQARAARAYDDRVMLVYLHGLPVSAPSVYSSACSSR